MTYKTVLFDLDGTVTDPGIGITNSIMYALHKFGIEVEDRTSLYPFIGPPLKESYHKYYGFDEAGQEQGVVWYREYYRDKGIFENILYDGMDRLLKQIKDSGRQVVLATSKPEEFADRILKHFGIAQYFDFVAGAAMDDTRTKKTEVIEYALESCGIMDVSTAVMVGDREYDILGAKAFGMDSIGVLYGYGDRQELEAAGATYIAEKVADIFGLL